MAFKPFVKFSKWILDNPVLNRSSRVLDYVVPALETLFFNISDGVLSGTPVVTLFFNISDGVLGTATGLTFNISDGVFSDNTPPPVLPTITVSVTFR